MRRPPLAAGAPLLALLLVVLASAPPATAASPGVVDPAQTTDGTLDQSTDGGTLDQTADGGTLDQSTDGGTLYQTTDGGTLYQTTDRGTLGQTADVMIRAQTTDGGTLAQSEPQTNNTTTTTERPGIDGLAFFTTYSRDAAPPVRIGFSARPDADGFFVLTTASGEVVGMTEYRSFDGAVAVDGLPVPFTRPVSGVVDLTVTAYDDTNGNREFDPGVDEPYRDPDGEPVASSLSFVFPARNGSIQGRETTLEPPEPGAVGLHHFGLEAQRELAVRAVALDYRYSGIDIPEDGSIRAGTGVRLPGKSSYRTDAERVEQPMTGLVVIYPEDPFVLDEGEDFLVNLEGVENPRDARNVTVLVNPYGAGHSATMTIEPGHSVPSIDLVQVSPDERDTVSVNLYFPEGRTGVVQVSMGGTVIGRSPVVGGQPEMHVDFLEVPLDRELGPDDEITVTLLNDVDADSQYEQPFRVDGEPIERHVTVLEGLEPPTDPTTGETGTNSSTNETTTTAPTTTLTTVPGFGPLLAVLGLLVAALAIRRL